MIQRIQYLKSAYNQLRKIHIARNVSEMREFLRFHKKEGDSVGFVPTMGALHEGHLSLAKISTSENKISIASIYVNPTQFSMGEDLDKYPRTFESDLSLLRKAGVHCVFYPSTKEMYPDNYLCYVEPKAFSNISEGIARPDFFRGVATMVSKLFNIVNPDRSYFGQKDISQCILIKTMIRDLHFQTKIIVCPTIREVDGLAMSSRNTYLNSKERTAAPVLYRALSVAQDMFSQSSNVRLHRDDLIKSIESVLKSEPLVSSVEYVSIASPVDMKELDYLNNEGAVISSAVRCGKVRLIDNILVGPAHDYIFSN